MSTRFKVLIFFACFLFVAATVADAAPFWPFHTGHVSKYTRAKADGTSWSVTMEVIGTATPDAACTTGQYYELKETNYDNDGKFNTLYLSVTENAGYQCDTTNHLEIMFFQTGPEGTSWSYPDPLGTDGVKFQVVSQTQSGAQYAIKRVERVGNVDQPPVFNLFTKGFGLIKETDWNVGDTATDPWTQVRHGYRGLTLYAIWPSGIYTYDYDGTKTWAKIHSSVPNDWVASGPILYVTWPSGIFVWDGNAWHKLHSSVPSKMVAVGSRLYVTWPSGLYMWSNATNAWTKIHSTVPTNMFTSRLAFYCTWSSGIYMHDGSTFTRLHTSVPTKMLTPP